jgi:hypothetical protein
MGYLNNQVVTVDAILTKKGRETLAKNDGSFRITQFALADDEIDYDLWNPDHPLGTDYYGTIIENMPIVEAIPDETQMLKYKLITLPKKTTKIPVVNVGNTSITLSAEGDIAVISPNTSNFTGGNATLGYTAILSNSDVVDLRVAPGGDIQTSVLPTAPRFIGDNEDAQSVAVTGRTFELIAKRQVTEQTATITIIGNETGGSTTINLTVKAATVNT